MSSFSITFDWLPTEERIRDGRYGTVFLGMRTDTSELITVEQLDLDESDDTFKLVLSCLDMKRILPSEPNIVPYLGYQQKAEHIFIFTPYSSGGTLRELIEKNHTLPLSVVRNFLRQIILGQQQLQKQGFTIVLLDSDHIHVGNTGVLAIEAPLLDITILGPQLPPTFLTLPELILSQQNIRKADVWLLGIVAVQLLSKKCDVTTIDSIRDISTQIKGNLESADELFISKNTASKLDKQTRDFLRQCFIININDRPSISSLLEHPFIKNTE